MTSPSEMTVPEFIQHVARSATVVGWQAGVGAMETAGSIISYLAEHPEALPAFLETGSIIDWPAAFHREGCLTWHGQNGKVCLPEFAHKALHDFAREAFKSGFDLASAATYRGGWEQAWEWSKIGDKVAALKSPT